MGDVINLNNRTKIESVQEVSREEVHSDLAKAFGYLLITVDADGMPVMLHTNLEEDCMCEVLDMVTGGGNAIDDED